MKRRIHMSSVFFSARVILIRMIPDFIGRAKECVIVDIVEVVISIASCSSVLNEYSGFSSKVLSRL
jgi:hypothetical protein